MRTVLYFLCMLGCLAGLSRQDMQAEAPDADGFIHHWLMLAPVPLEDGEAAANAIEFNVIRREALLQPRAGDAIKIAGRQFVWTEMHSESEVFDFNVELGDRVEHAIGYLVAYIDSPHEHRMVQLLVGGNDQARVFFNGEPVSTTYEARALTKDSDVAKGLTLHQGRNTVVLKVINEVGNWQGCLRFTTENGQPITDFKLVLHP